METISVINLKGGVAKTITSISFAHILATVHNKKVLLIDNDKQGNTSKSFDLHSNDKPSVSDILTNKNIKIYDVIRTTQYSNLDLIPANMSLVEANLKVIFDQTRPRETRFSKALQKIQQHYDYCIIDNAPDINISTINSLVASDTVIIPIKIDRYSVDGLAELTEQIDSTRESYNSKLELGGCLITQFYNNEECIQEEEKLRKELKYPVYQTHIRRTPKVDGSTFHAMPILEFSKTCSASKDYLAFTQEFLGK